MKSRLLIVDDEPDMRLLLRLTLRDTDFHIDEVGTGEEALSLVDKHGFDFVLLDLNLPGMSGMDVLRRWNEQGIVTDMAVFMLTADAREGLSEEALALGCRDYLSKPIPPKDLLSRISQELGTDPGSPATLGGT